MALGVVGDVDEQAADAGRQLLAPNAAEGSGVNRCQGKDALFATREGCLHLGEQVGAGLVSTLLKFEGCKLVWRKLVAFRVGEQAVEAAGDVPQLEADGGQAEGLGVHLGSGEAVSPLGDIFPGEVEGVQDATGYGGNLGAGAGKPGFEGWCGLGSGGRFRHLVPCGLGRLFGGPTG